MKEIDAIKIDEIKLENNTEKSNIYIAKVAYNDLDKLFKLGNISINREVDSDRAKKMSEYIKDRNSFYPTIVAATNSKNIISYNEQLKTIKIKFAGEDNKFIVIDGQHRFKSILELKNDTSNRYQSILLIDNINDFQQRKIFIDINDTPKKVTTGTKLRFKKTIENYITLSFLNDDDDLLKYIDMDENQTGKNNKIPYKYLYKFNEMFIKDLSNNFKKDEIKFDKIDKLYKKEILEVNRKIKTLILEGIKEENSISKYEIFYSTLGEKCSKNLKEIFDNNKPLDINSINLKLESIIKSYKNISEKFLEKIPKTPSGKKTMIDKILDSYLGE